MPYTIPPALSHPLALPSILRLFTLISILLITACTTPPQTITVYPAIGEGGDLTYLGPDPEHKNRSLVRVHDVTLTVFSTVLGPTLDSLHLLNHTRIEPGETVLDLGTGSGVQAIFAARNAKYVVATDIDPQAGNNARFNIQQLGLENRIDVRVGDMFSPLAIDERFDVILLNLKYPHGGAQNPIWELHERFFAGVKKHLEPNGRIYYQFGYEQNQTHVKKMLSDNQLYIADKRMGRTTNIKNGLFLTFEIRSLDTSTPS